MGLPEIVVYPGEHTFRAQRWVFEAAKAVADPDFIPTLLGDARSHECRLARAVRFFVRLDVALFACRWRQPFGEVLEDEGA